MNIAWLFAENTLLPPTVDTQPMRDIAPIWGSWRTQRSYKTDNVICHDADQAHKLVEQGYTDICNLFVHQTVWEELNNPRVRRYGGEFLHDVTSTDDIVAMHLASSVNSVLLLVGFEFSKPKRVTETQQNYLGLAAEVVKSNPKCQWVLVDHDAKLADPFNGLSNITCDSLPNVLKLLQQ